MQLPLIKLIGGLVIFLFGMNIVRKGLERASGDKLRSTINRLIKGRFRAWFTGVITTFIMESSGAATVMFVGFASVGIVDLFQAIALTAGATVGTTLFVLILAQFITFKLTNFSLGLLIIGYVLTMLKKKGTVRYLGDVIMGFGLLFLGIYFMIESVSAISGTEFFKSQINTFENNPVLGIFIAAIFTAIIHSSAGTIGIALSLTTLGVLSLEGALPIIIGANVGTCFTAILASLNSPIAGKRVAWAHLAMKLIGSVLLLPILGYYAEFIQSLTGSINFQVAFAHFFFNLFNSIIILAAMGPFVKFVEKVMPEENEEEGKFAPKYLDEGSLDTPSIAFANAMREILRMSDINREILKQSTVVFEKNDMKTVEKLEDMDDRIDVLNREIKFYLAKITQTELTDSQAKKEMDLVNITTNMEVVGDLLTKPMMEVAIKKIKQGFEFSQEGWTDIKHFHAKVMENYGIAVNALAAGDTELAKKAIRNKSKIRELEEELRQNHFMRLAQGTKESVLTSSLHMEILGILRRVNSYITRIGYIILEQN